MEGKSHMADQTLLLFLCDPGKAVQLLIDLIMMGSHIMDQIVVKVICTCLTELLLKDPVPVLLCLKISRMQLGCQCISASVMTLYQCFPDSLFTFEGAVHPRCIKIGKASFYKGVYHLLHLVKVNACGITLI